MSKATNDINEISIRIARTFDTLKLDVMTQNNELARTQLKLGAAIALLHRSKVWVDKVAKENKHLATLQYDIDEFLFKGI